MRNSGICEGQDMHGQMAPKYNVADTAAKFFEW